MNNDLISREALKKQVKELLDLAVKRVDDTPTNSPCYRMYVAQENERARLIKLIDNAPTVPMQGQELGCEICVNRNIKSKEACTSPFGECEFFNCGADMRKGEENEVN